MLRVVPGQDTLAAGRIVLAVALIFFYVRLLHVFSANKLLGPKLIMIQKMVRYQVYSFVVDIQHEARWPKRSIHLFLLCIDQNYIVTAGMKFSGVSEVYKILMIITHFS